MNGRERFCLAVLITNAGLFASARYQRRADGASGA